MESIKELRDMLQKGKVAPEGWRRPLGYYALQRFPSIYITRLLLPMRITPNQITVTGFLLGLVGCWFVLQWAWHLKLIGIGLLYLNVLFDKVDGELARYKKIYSLKGIYLDYTNHLLIPALFFLALTIGLLPFSLINPDLFLGGGVLAAFSMMVLRAQASLPEVIFIKKYLPRAELFSASLHENSFAAIKRTRPALARASWLLHHAQEHFLHLLFFAIIFAGERFLLRDFLFHPAATNGVLFFAAVLFFFVVENAVKGWITIDTTIKHRISVNVPDAD
jgi:phosphatidylglycerophosphate synthase